MDDYQKFIALSRYARWLPEEGRRERWEETVNRYINFMRQRVAEKINPLNNIWDKAREAIINLEVMPSMRALMSAGPALKRDNTAGYNCCYLPVDDLRSFDEALYILMCGTGVGFSVEQQYVNKLPPVPNELFHSHEVIKVEDSKEGWADATRQLLHTLMVTAHVPMWDVSAVRPAGARLETFGGRASGPAPLVDLFNFIIETFKRAVGRQLTSLECHDIMCKIGEIVVVGGVRRSALISLSNLSDEQMAVAKSGAWYTDNVQRALANNSAVYLGKPSVGEFLKEWTSLYNSKSGERGIFNRAASDNQVKQSGRRQPGFDWGTNPCSEIILRPYQFCNLTEVVVRHNDTPGDLDRKVELASFLGTVQSTLTDFPYLRDVWKQNTEEERLLGVSMTGILDHPTLANHPGLLSSLRATAVLVNKETAEKLGIPQSAAVTCVKPSGTVSQLVDSASGCHARHAPYYIRRVRADVKDPLSTFMQSVGIPCEPCVYKPDSVLVFSFPKKAPTGATLRKDQTALDQLNIWMNLQKYWCEHKPSVTISVKEDEWVAVADFVYREFDSISGVSFLPFSEHTYQQAPYEDCTEEQYNELLSKMPKDINWDLLQEFEQFDTTKGSQTMACSGDFCEVVDLV